MLSLYAAGLFVALYSVGFAVRQIVRCRRLPPGPSGWPVIGNISDLPPPECKDWEHWIRFKSTYGPISSITSMGQILVILNSADVATGVLEKPSNITASRPVSVVLQQLTGWDRQVSFQPDIDVVRVERKQILETIGSPKLVQEYSDQLKFEAGRFLFRLLEAPSNFVSHIRKQTGATIFKIAYGYNIEPHGSDALVEISDRSAQEICVAAPSSGWLIDRITVLRYLPSFTPGLRVKRLARVWKQTLDDLAEVPWRFVLQQMERGEHHGSYLSKHLEALGHAPSPEEERTIKWTAATMYVAGSDTATIHTFILAMLLNPEVQSKAQLEIDEVVGRDRLPETGDLEKLPFAKAVISEVLRWHPVAPLGVTHRATADVSYKEYIIPKGALLIPNIWAITHDPLLYNEPMSFNPSRFLAQGESGKEKSHEPEPDPRQFVFGFGRRICPGRFLADATLSLTILQTLAVFKIGKVVRDGKEVDVKAEFLPGLLCHPKEFEADIIPRYNGAERLVRENTPLSSWPSGDGRKLQL